MPSCLWGPTRFPSGRLPYYSGWTCSGAARGRQALPPPRRAPRTGEPLGASALQSPQKVPEGNEARAAGGPPPRLCASRASCVCACPRGPRAGPTWVREGWRRLGRRQVCEWPRLHVKAPQAAWRVCEQQNRTGSRPGRGRVVPGGEEGAGRAVLRAPGRRLLLRAPPHWPAPCVGLRLCPASPPKGPVRGSSGPPTSLALCSVWA